MQEFVQAVNDNDQFDAPSQCVRSTPALDLRRSRRVDGLAGVHTNLGGDQHPLVGGEGVKGCLPFRRPTDQVRAVDPERPLPPHLEADAVEWGPVATWKRAFWNRVPISPSQTVVLQTWPKTTAT